MDSANTVTDVNIYTQFLLVFQMEKKQEATASNHTGLKARLKKSLVAKIYIGDNSKTKIAYKCLKTPTLHFLTCKFRLILE